MLKKIIGILCMVLALVCIGTAVYGFIAAKGGQSIWSVDVLGATAFHAVFMMIGVFLLVSSNVDKDNQTKEV